MRMFASLLLLLSPALAGELEQSVLRSAQASMVGVQARVMRTFTFGGQTRSRRVPARLTGVVIGEGRILTGPLGDDPQNLKVFVPGTEDGIDAELEESGPDFSVITAEGLTAVPLSFKKDWDPAIGEKLVWVGMLSGSLGKWNLIAKSAEVDVLIKDEQTDTLDVYSDPPFGGPVLVQNAPVFNREGRPIGVLILRRSAAGGGRRGGGRQPGLPVIRLASAFSGWLDGSVQRRAVLGVSVEPLGEAVAEALGLTGTPAVVVTQVTPGSGADKAGLRAQDMITQVDGKPMPNGEALRAALRGKAAGDKITIVYLRDAGGGPQKAEVEATLTARDAQAAKERHRARRFGFVAQPLTDAVRRDQNLPADVSGVYVRRVTRGGPAGLGRPTPLRRGDVILKVGEDPTSDLASLKAVLQSLPDGKPVTLFVRNGANTRFVEITPEKPSE
ncbi:MAG: PDZ domain-containing protein [Planctomycetota bacterium]|nr:PDZ domain-containing protein [Planctomycetota bacterium]